MWLATQKNITHKRNVIGHEYTSDDNKCCLCQDTVMETNKHFIVVCEYVLELRDALLSLLNINLFVWSGATTNEECASKQLHRKIISLL